MALSDYSVKRDKFQAKDGLDRLCFPCSACKWEATKPHDEPCRTCDHNHNCVADTAPVADHIASAGKMIPPADAAAEITRLCVKLRSDATARIEAVIDALLRAAQPDQNGWRPIATAPDGEAVLMCEDGDCVVGVKEGNRLTTDINPLKEDPYAPTHWMPLPDPPEESDSAH